MIQVSLFTVIRSYYAVVRQRRLAFFGVFAFYGLASIGGGIIAPLIYRHIIDLISGATERAALASDLWQTLGFLVVTIAIYQGFYRLGDFMIVGVQSKTMEDLNTRSFRAFMRLGYGFFVDRFSGSLVAQARRYTRTFEDISDQLIFNFWLPFVHLSGVIGSLFFIQPLLASIFLLWIPLYISVAIYITRRKLPYDTESATQDSAITAQFADVLSNMFAVKTFASEERESITFGAVAKRDEVARRRAWRFNNLLIAIQTVLFSVLEVVAMYTVIRLWLAGTVSTGTVVLVQVYIGSIFSELFGLGRAFGKLMKNVADAGEMIETLNRTDGESLETTRIEKGELADRSIVFDNISFRYSKGGSVFDHFSLSLKPGEKVGLVGASGSGKSTLTKLLLRFIVPNDGVIRVAGRNVADMTPQELRQLIAYVPQDTALFHRTIAENIAYGRAGATSDMIVAAAKKAHAHEFISALPQGYETLVGERGVKLSGGERQRVAIARAILKDAPILVLDEATSALDTTSEHYIQEALHELMQGRTTIVIAHRLSTVREMDRIVVLEHGRVAEEGTHNDLIAQDGIYAGFWNRQTSSFADVLLADDEATEG